MESSLSYSVFSAASAAAGYAILGTTSPLHSTESTHPLNPYPVRTLESVASQLTGNKVVQPAEGQAGMCCSAGASRRPW
jgi:hypothetical protein